MPELDGQYTVFGHVTEGMDVLDALSLELADTNNNPTTPIVIKNAYLGAPHPQRAPFTFKIWPWGR
jgi:cyclophilin family peptidyl-prolyl cis-trans isomerase